MQITAIRTQPLTSDDTEHISAVKGIDKFGVTKTWLLSGVVQLIQIGESVFIQFGAHRTDVEVYLRNGHHFIRSRSNGTTKDNLLNLPRF